MDRRAWWAMVLGVTKSWTQLSDLTHTHSDASLLEAPFTSPTTYLN